MLSGDGDGDVVVCVCVRTFEEYLYFRPVFHVWLAGFCFRILRLTLQVSVHMPAGTGISGGEYPGICAGIEFCMGWKIDC